MLVKNVILRFKRELFPFINKVMDHLLTQNTSSASSHVVMSMYEAVIVTSQVYEDNEINLDKIFGLMQKTYVNGDYGMFSRLIRYYHSVFNAELLAKSF